MKKIISIIIAILIMTSVCASATTVEFIIGDTTMATVLNNTADRQLTTSQLPAAPFIANDRTMVPVRAVSESFDCQVSWNAELRQVKIVNGNEELLLYIDSATAYVNGIEITLDTAPVIVGDITFVPVRFVTENLGFKVTFVSGINSVMIYDQDDKINLDGNSVLFPVADVLNYNIAMNYGIHPEETDDVTYKNYSSLLINLYDYYGNYLVDNSLALSENFYITANDIAMAYPSNFLKGEVSLLFGMLGAESATKSHLAQINASAINEYYNREYTRAKHILISFQTYSEEEALALANEICNSLKNGEDYDTLVAQYNEDPGMTQDPNGYVFTKGVMVKEFEDAAFALSPGEISEPVKSVYGYHIIQGAELPEISEEITHECVNALYINPLAESMNKAISGQ